jgi:predicted nucleic acid-binding protein
MRVLFDTDVLLDVLLRREPFVAAARPLFAQVELGRLDGVVSASAITTVFYLARRSLGTGPAREHLRTMLRLFRAAPITHEILASALDLDFGDYEDAVVHEAARVVGADGIVTRNTGDYRRATIPVYTPEELGAVMAGD